MSKSKIKKDFSLFQLDYSLWIPGSKFRKKKIVDVYINTKDIIESKRQKKLEKELETQRALEAQEQLGSGAERTSEINSLNKEVKTDVEVHIDTKDPIFKIINDTFANKEIVSTKDGVKFIYSLGLPLSMSELEILKSKYKKTIPTSEIAQLIAAKKAEAVTAAELIEAFEAVDANHLGKLSYYTIKCVLMYGVEGLSTEEVNLLLKSYDSQELIDYKALAERIIGSNNEAKKVLLAAEAIPD